MNAIVKNQMTSIIATVANDTPSFQKQALAKKI